MRRILHVFGQMSHGGAETFTMNVYRHIDRQQVQFDFAVHTSEQGHYDEEISAMGGRILVQESPARAGFQAYGRALAQILQAQGPFAGVHSHVHHFSGYALRVAERSGVPLRLAHSHTTDDGVSASWVRRVYHWQMRRLLRRHATHLLGCSRAACQALFGTHCWQDPRVRVLPNAIDLATYEVLPEDKAVLRREFSLPPDCPLIGHVGRFSAEKNHRFLVEVFAGLVRELPAAHLVLVGDGSLRAETQALVQADGIGGRVHFLGSRPDVPRILGALDLFLFPSLYEGLGIAVIEAQAAGVPCLASTAVPAEADIGVGLVQFAGLRDGIHLWVRKALRCLDTRRPDWGVRKRALTSAGRDILEAASWLQRVYCGD